MAIESSTDPREVVNVRVLDAPRESIHEAYRDPEQLKLWWGPDGFTNTNHTFDFRPGGAWTYTMHGPDGTDYPNESEFVELAMGRIVLDHLRPMHRFRMTMTYDEAEGRTLATWRMRFETLEECAKVKPWVEAANEQNLDRLTAHLAELAKREVRTTRLVSAPLELVWKVWTDPNHVGNWWGPNGFRTTTYAMDVRPGGVWRYVMHGPDGRDYQNKVTYLEIVEPERLVYRHGGGEGDLEPVDFLVTATFHDIAGKTKVVLRSLFPSVESRDRVIRDYRADVGAEQHLARLDEYAQRM